MSLFILVDTTNRRRRRRVDSIKASTALVVEWHPKSSSDDDDNDNDAKPKIGRRNKKAKECPILVRRWSLLLTIAMLILASSDCSSPNTVEAFFSRYSRRNSVRNFPQPRYSGPSVTGSLPRSFLQLFKDNKSNINDNTITASSSEQTNKPKKVKRKTKTVATNDTKTEERYYWVNDSDPVIIKRKKQPSPLPDHPSSRITALRFKVRGNPRPLRRHRTNRGHMYNPSFKYQSSFQQAVDSLLVANDIVIVGSDLVVPTVDATDDDDETVSFTAHDDLEDSTELTQPQPAATAAPYDKYPIFGADKYLAMTIVFSMKRARSHFVNNKPGVGRLKPTAPGMMSTIRTDIDNLVKFVLDSMNEVLYEDDKQVTTIHATKLLDNDDLCEGSIEVYLRSIENDTDMNEIIGSSFEDSQFQSETV
jgi:Holliday junction resolvase RusA-like endonuclease